MNKVADNTISRTLDGYKHNLSVFYGGMNRDVQHLFQEKLKCVRKSKVIFIDLFKCPEY